MPDKKEVRRELAKAWRAAHDRLLAEGYDAMDVTDTMLSVALASWSGLRGKEAAAERLSAVAGELTKRVGTT